MQCDCFCHDFYYYGGGEKKKKATRGQASDHFIPGVCCALKWCCSSTATWRTTSSMYTGNQFSTLQIKSFPYKHYTYLLYFTLQRCNMGTQFPLSRFKLRTEAYVSTLGLMIDWLTVWLFYSDHCANLLDERENIRTRSLAG